MSSALTLLFFVGLLAATLAPDVLPRVALIPTEATQLSGTYRFITYAFFHPRPFDWLVVSAVIMIAGHMAEPWLSVRAMWGLVVSSGIVGGLVFITAVRMPEAAVGGGFIAAGVAGGAVVGTFMRRRQLGRRAQLAALALLLVYGLAPLQPTPSSLAMWGAFIAGGAFAGWQIRKAVVHDVASAA